MNRVAIAIATATAAAFLGGCPPGTPPPVTPEPTDDADVDDPDPVDAAPPADAGDLAGYPWSLVWRDEFDGAAGTRPDATKWKHDVGGDGWGNEQLEFDTDRTENAAHDGQGRLAIVARQEDYGGRSYTSARLNTHGKFERTYGRFDARIQLPRGQGIWPAFWLLGANFANAGWPGCGEVDIMEYRGQETNMIRGSLHGPGYSGGANHGRENNVGVDLSLAFHTYTVEWDPERVVWKVDDEVFFTATPSDLPEGTDWVYDHNFFIILNLAVGGNYVGFPNGATTFPQTMLVDYVRVYERLP
jgi:beta-glucanase (GH16 family)